MNLDLHLRKQLKTLRLGRLLQSLDIHLQQAQSSTLGHLRFLNQLLQDEIEWGEAKKLSASIRKYSNAF